MSPEPERANSNGRAWVEVFRNTNDHSCGCMQEANMLIMMILMHANIVIYPFLELSF